VHGDDDRAARRQAVGVVAEHLQRARVAAEPGHFLDGGGRGRGGAGEQTGDEDGDEQDGLLHAAPRCDRHHFLSTLGNFRPPREIRDHHIPATDCGGGTHILR
jgi:hypothetical protein